MEAFDRQAHNGVLVSVAGPNVLDRRSARAIAPLLPEPYLVSYPKLGVSRRNPEDDIRV
jgi:hypothetical protein